jgi:uroporphyrin-III C-methyltransferase
VSVSLVGAGPGDPGLITVRGLELVRACDALVYDRLVSPDLVAEAPENAMRVARDRLSQDEVNDLLVNLGRAGLRTVRLKGGDPFVFGRGGEEAIALSEAGIAFEVVPGVSSLSAVPASAGIPVTHRGAASQVTAITAHSPEQLDYRALARLEGTLVLFMGLESLPMVARRLVAAGKRASTPAAIIERGSLPGQRVVRTSLARLPEASKLLGSPALTVIGEVVAVGDRINAGLASSEGPLARLGMLDPLLPVAVLH